MVSGQRTYRFKLWGGREGGQPRYIHCQHPGRYPRPVGARRYLVPCIYSYPVAHKPKLELHYLLQLAHEIEFGSKTFSGKASQSLQRSLVMVTPLSYYHPGSAYGTREDCVQLFSSSLQFEAYAHIKTCNHDKDTQLLRALAILSCSFWRSSLRKGGGQTGSCSSCSADMISTTCKTERERPMSRRGTLAFSLP